MDLKKLDKKIFQFNEDIQLILQYARAAMFVEENCLTITHKQPKRSHEYHIWTVTDKDGKDYMISNGTKKAKRLTWLDTVESYRDRWNG